jgi:predicted RNA-binding protein with PUA-like domain
MLDELKTIPELGDMLILRKGNRLSITPVSKVEWDVIVNIVK